MDTLLDGRENTQRREKDPPAVLAELAALADVRFDGDRPWDIQVKDERLYRRILTHGSLGFGEAYMDGWWECERLDELVFRLLSARIEERLGGFQKLRLFGEVLRHAFVNLQSPRRAYEVGERHYDIGNDVFSAMLDRTMSYSCAYWKDAQTLDEAQEAKLDLACRKLELQKGERVLDIGCGWGGFAYFAADRYGVDVYGVTISKEQAEFARARCRGLPVTIELKDYRALEGKFDKIVSIGMFEHVGPKNYGVYFDVARRCLKDDGLFLLHTIGIDRTTPHTDPWIDRYIFPNGKLPSAAEIAIAVEGRFLILDWHEFGLDYERTLLAWWDNFARAWPRLAPKYGERFYRMWRYYLMSCAGFFRSRQGQLWQIVLAPFERKAVYRAPR
ncbi:MAG: cyclopropane fatty acyl phospholipid synthase [Rhodocyclaceae bacterium]|nr:cyclopropane fatty acyl phospholipid synthase [Rhodocyclaceae bacterium]